MKNTPTQDGSGHPTPQVVVQRHRPVLRRIVEALRKGTAHTRWYFDHMDEDIDRALAPALVRKGAKRDLLATGKREKVEVVEDASPDSPAGLSPNADPTGKAEFLSNLGLAVSAEGIRFRILRSDDGTVPVPGPSKARQAFYSQEAYFPGWDAMVREAIGHNVAIPSDVTNCILHWDTDDEYNLTNVYLALPLSGDTTRESVQLHWNEIIWRRHAPSVDGRQVNAETIDQDIYIDDEASGTGK